MKLKEFARKSIIFLPVFLPFFVIRFSVGPVPTTALEVAIYLVFLLNLGSANIKIKWSRQLLFALLFVLSGLLGVWADPDLFSALGLYKAYFIDGFLVYLLVVNLSDKDKDSLTNLLIFSGVVASAGAIACYMLGIKADDGRIVDLSLLNSNYLAMYLAPIFILTLAKIRRQVSVRVYFLILAALVVALTMYLTQSRGIIIATIPALIYLMYNLFKQKTGMLKIGFVLFTLLFFIAGYLYYQPDWSDAGRKATSSNVRYYIWTTSLEMVRSNPVWGVGLSNYQTYFTNLTQDRVNYPEFIAPQALTAHNLYLQLYLTTGILGIVSFILLIVASLRGAKNFIYIAACIALLSYGLVDTPYFRNDLAILFWLLIATMYENRD